MSSLNHTVLTAARPTSRSARPTAIEVGLGFAASAAPDDPIELTPPAFIAPGVVEVKFGVSEDRVGELVVWLSQRTEADPHSDTEGWYEVESTYLDTEELSVFHRRPGYRKSKYRVRRYGVSGPRYIEQKKRAAGLVFKRRAQLDAVFGEIAWPASSDAAWFLNRVRERSLQPQTVVWYRRFARTAVSLGVPFRITVDRQLRSARASGVDLSAAASPSHGCGSGAVLEIKFRDALPQLAKQLLSEFDLRPATVSKYRSSVIASLGVAGEPDHA